MYARITRFRIKPESLDAAAQEVERLKPQILALPGMQHFINVANDDGEGYVISIVGEEALSDPGTEQVQAIWADMAQHLAGPPDAPMICKVIADWRA